MVKDVEITQDEGSIAGAQSDPASTFIPEGGSISRGIEPRDKNKFRNSVEDISKLLRETTETFIEVSKLPEETVEKNIAAKKVAEETTARKSFHETTPNPDASRKKAKE